MNVAIIGAGQNGGQVYNILKLDKSLNVVAFLDDSPAKQGTEKYGRPVAGTLAQLDEVVQRFGITAAIPAVGNNILKAKIARRLRDAGLQIVKAVHPHTFIDDTAVIEEGAIVEMGVMVHPEARIGACAFIGGSSVIAHDCTIESYALIGGGVMFGGGVTIGAYSTVGVGTILQPQVKIGRNVTTGIGAVVVKDLPDNAIAVGVPAKVIRYNEPLEENTLA